MIRIFLTIISLTLLTSTVWSQRDYEIGLEVTAANGSNLGGTVGGSVKFALVDDEEWAYGPSIRYQYFWSNNSFTGINNNASLYGGGVFVHYRFLEWFFLGTEIELLRNPFPVIDPSKPWALTGFLGGGISREYGNIRLNLGILYDVVDALRDPLESNPSPLRNSYMIRRQSPNPNAGVQGELLPIIYRVAVFIPIG